MYWYNAMFLSTFTMGDNSYLFVTYRFIPGRRTHSEINLNFKGKKKTFFLFFKNWSPTEKGSKNENGEVASPESVTIVIKEEIFFLSQQKYRKSICPLM